MPEGSDEKYPRVARRYDRVAGVYDLFETPMDWLGGFERRRRVLGRARGRTLEVGVGTGRNLDLYPDGVELVGIDISVKMLARAKKRAGRLGIAVDLAVADVENLPFENHRFDTATATCVFCSVQAPVRGLEELRRVVKPGGQVLLLEHVRPRNKAAGWVADKLTPVTRRLMGPDINRRTEDNIHLAGLDIVDIRRHGVWREIVARPRDSGGRR